MSDRRNYYQILQLTNLVKREGQNGWGVVLNALKPVLNPDKVLRQNSVFLDSFIESSFVKGIPGTETLKSPPYNQPWIGFAHNPPGIPEWHEYNSSPQEIIQLESWKASLAYCRGIVTLSQYLADWYASNIPGIAVTALKHPTATPRTLFNLAVYQTADFPKVVQVGWWLRRLHSIYELPMDPMKKAILEPTGAKHRHNFQKALSRELAELGYTVDTSQARTVKFLTQDGYEDLLSKTVVFIHLYDSSANNTIVECMVRNTPILVNPLPAVVEYLGPEYPFYFSDLEEAAEKASNLDSIDRAWQYLKNLPKDDLDCEFFYRSFVNSDLYKTLLENY